MGGLGTALVWYQKKIGSYDKQLWETNVEQHILSGMNSLPKKTTKLKTELIDVDLVRGSAFPKAKPQHGWIATTSRGVMRTLLLPLYFLWWQQQTSTAVCGAIFILYILQIMNLFLYFNSPEENNFQDVPASEVITPFVMMLLLGVMQSQIVSTVSTKSIHKSGLRTKRKRLKRKSRTRSVPPTCGCKSYPENSCEAKPSSLTEKYRSQSSGDLESFLTQKERSYSHPENNPNFYTSKKQPRQAKHSDEESGLDSLDFLHCHELPRESGISSLPVTDSKDSLCSSTNEERLGSAKYESDGDVSSEMLPHDAKKSCETKTADVEDAGWSSGDEYFIAKHSHYAKSEKYSKGSHQEQAEGTGLLAGIKDNRLPLYWRRFSDFERSKERENSVERLKLTETARRLSEGLVGNRTKRFVSPLSFEEKPAVHSSYRQKLYTVDAERGCRSFHLPIKRDFCSSCESDGDTAPNSPTKPENSDSEWPVMSNTDCNSDSTDSVEATQDDSPSLVYEDPLIFEMQEAPGQLFSAYNGSDKGRRPAKVSCTIWERNECKKVDLTVLDISSSIIRKVDALSQSSEYFMAGLICAFFIALLPSLYRLQSATIKEALHDVTSDVLLLNVPSTDEMVRMTGALQNALLGNSLRTKIVVLIAFLERFVLGAIYFFLLSVAERTFKQRFLYAKHFCHLTSARRARRSDLPHFRLNKVRNIKTWLSVRSYLKKQGPQRSVDVVVSMSFIISICLLSFLCLQMLKETEDVLDRLYSWEIVCWCLVLGLFLMRFMILGSKINKKYRNLSVLLTEQINLYLHMEQKPHKKEELTLANNVLKLAADLLKELESPFKISGLCANPYLYNVTKVVVLSAFSAVLTELLGFKLKLHKIKIK